MLAITVIYHLETLFCFFIFFNKRSSKKKKSALVLTEEEYLRKDKDGRECPVPQVGFPALLGKV